MRSAVKSGVEASEAILVQLETAMERIEDYEVRQGVFARRTKVLAGCDEGPETLESRLIDKVVCMACGFRREARRKIWESGVN